MDTYPRPNGNCSFSILNSSQVVCLLLIFTSLIWSCQAQGHSDDEGFSTPALIFTVIASSLCFIFWVGFIFMCFIFVCCSRNRRNTTSLIYNAQPSPTTYPRPQTHTTDLVYGQPHPSQRPHAVESRFPVPSTILYSPPTYRAGHNSSQIESASIPEATLHQGDAPPAYEEAIK